MSKTLGSRSKRNWKRVHASSLRQAMELCKEHAREKHNLSVERIAERIGLADHWVLYKWIASAKMPAVMIPAFESACGIDLISRYLATRAGRLVIDMPRGKAAGSEDVQALQGVLHEAMGALMRFYAQEQEAEDTLAAVQRGLESLAWHRGNVQKHSQPELELAIES